MEQNKKLDQFESLSLYLDWYIEKMVSLYFTPNPQDSFARKSDHQKFMIRSSIPDHHYPFEPSTFKKYKLDGWYEFRHFNFISFNYRKI